MPLILIHVYGKVHLIGRKGLTIGKYTQETYIIHIYVQYHPTVAVLYFKGMKVKSISGFIIIKYMKRYMLYEVRYFKPINRRCFYCIKKLYFLKGPLSGE